MAERKDTQFEPGRLKVRVVTPERVLLEADAATVTLPGLSGVLEVLPAAAPLLTAIGAGELLVTGSSGGEQTLIVARGFAEILPDRVTVLVEYAEAPDAVDKAAAEEQLRAGQKAVEEAGQDPERYGSARLTVLEAEAKLGQVGA